LLDLPWEAHLGPIKELVIIWMKTASVDVE
jgi:hypothetical protein